MPNNLYTPSDIKILKKLYPDTPNKDIASSIGRSVYSIENKSFQLGLKKSKAFKSAMINKSEMIIAKKVIYVTQTFYIIPSKMNFI